MNPQRPNCLNNDYENGCEIPEDAYVSRFEGFASIVKNEVQQNENLGKKSLELQDQSERCSRNHFTNTNQKSKRDIDHGLGKKQEIKENLIWFYEFY